MDVSTPGSSVTVTAPSSLHDRIAAIGPYFLISLGMGACAGANHFHWQSLDNLGGQVVAAGLALMTQQIKATLDSSKWGGARDQNQDPALPPPPPAPNAP